MPFRGIPKMRAQKTALPTATFLAVTVMASMFLGLGAASAGVHSYGYRSDSGTDFSYALITKGSESASGSGDMVDFDEARRLQRKLGTDVLWVRLGDERYMISDSREIAKAQHAMAPVQAMGRRQGELGRQQGELGRQQGRLGRQQGTLGRRQGELGAQQGRIAAQIARRSARGESTRDLEREADRIARQVDELAAQQDELARQQDRFARQQGPLAARQQELARQQEKLSLQLARDMEGLIHDAMRRGTARRLD